MKSILLADDEFALRTLAKMALRSPEHTIIEATDGNEAWDLLWASRPALAVLDVQMPGRSGLDLARAIRSEPELASIKIIVLSAKAQQEDIQSGLAAGADLYLTKPFSPVQLIASVRQLLNSAPAASHITPQVVRREQAMLLPV